ncbi:hypothetical protein [Arcobacter sp. FWKO B]|uniref:hypothetical protein n=1 Tax=Arcobacter sp. FWKO B TaxID=2593672 RepID=UPI0018A40C06|nr:hypothetical protein [Arcobacter sp. FWKO B]QOG11232.1 hypothetical protein FWKOB_00360 [Arcobacter sp. FWKO B]
MLYKKICVLICFTFSLFASDLYVDNIELAKAKKLVQKEEQIALAYKKYILKYGAKPTIDNLISNGFLPQGFSKINPFGKEMKISTTTHTIEDGLPVSLRMKAHIYDYYYANINRVNTKAPISIKNNYTQMVLSTKEEYIISMKNENKLTSVKSEARNKYYLDDKGVLNWYDNDGKYVYSYDKNLLIDDMFDTSGNIKTAIYNLLETNKALYAGQIIYNLKDNVAQKHLNIGGEGKKIVKIGGSQKDIGKTIIQFTRRAGGMIVNGDIYTWGNNANKITGIEKNTYTGSGGSNRYPVINSLVRAKVKTYDNAIDSRNYFSSPLRPKFVDFFATVYHGTCGVATDGAIYCGGSTGAETTNLFTNINKDGSSAEMLYKSSFFDGSTGKKATKIMANNQIWLILANTSIEPIDGSYKNGQIWRWGRDFAGFSGDSKNTTYKYDNTGNPTELIVTSGGTKVLFKDLTYLLTIGYRKMGALSNEGDVWIWGLDDYYTQNCTQTIGGKSVNLCIPYKVSSNIAFSSLKGGLQGFVAKGVDGNFYKISQKWGELPKVESLTDAIRNSGDDNEILAVDLSSKLSGTSLIENAGIVWVNSKNELRGDYFTASNVNDTLFKKAIETIKWKNIKVIEDDNGMCGIDIYNQMYCWGIVSYTRSGTSTTDYIGNTFMLPVFNTNLYDLDKDFLVAEGGRNGHLTPISSGDWTTGGGTFFLKYPTYIGGFNYEFIFK